MVFLDANIPLELILKERKRVEDVQKFIDSQQETFISTLTIHLIYYLGLREKARMGDLHLAVGLYKILDFTAEDYEWARENCVDDDFEDALQVAIAVNNGCGSFVTLDKSLASNYKKHIKMILI